MYRRNESGSTQPAECCVSRLLVDNLVVIGTGFMGASLAAAVKSRGLARQVIGIDPAEAQRAKLLGFIDQVIDRVDRLADSSVAKAGSLAVVIASPVPTFNQILGDLQKSAHRGSLPLQWITDIGSTKRSLISAVENNLTDLAALFVSSHPMAGSEKQGAADADSNLFQGARVLMSRLPRTTDDTFNAVEEFWVALGGSPARCRLMITMHSWRRLVICPTLWPTALLVHLPSLHSRVQRSRCMAQACATRRESPPLHQSYGRIFFSIIGTRCYSRARSGRYRLRLLSRQFEMLIAIA